MTSSQIIGELYESLFEAIEEQRTRIAFFEPVLFHAHSVDSHDWAKDADASSARNEPAGFLTPEGLDAFLDELAVRYRVVCITDHMRCGYATRLAQAAESRDDITVLPGMEINCLPPPHYADAIHVLAVFPPESSEVGIERIFHGKSLTDPESRSGVEAVRFDDLGELRSRIHEAGGMFLLAHVENEKRGHRARFRIDRGRTLAMFVEEGELEHDLAEEYGVYLASLQPDAIELQRVEHQHHYARFTVGDDEYQVACVAPADHHCFEDYEKPDTATLLKVPRCDFASVREALRFHETRVRLPGQTTEHAAPRLLGMRLMSPNGNGLFVDTTIAFSPNLNCIIGPRGSGKSTVIEALRYVLGRNTQLSERAGREVKSFADLAQSTQSANLRDTRLELVYEHDESKQTVLSATFDANEDLNTRGFTLEGKDLRIGDQALLGDFPVAIFSWSEMEVLGREPGPQRDLVDRLLPGVSGLVAHRDLVSENLTRNSTELMNVVGHLVRARAANGGRLGRYRQYREAYTAINTPEAASLFAGLDGARQRREVIDSVASLVAGVNETVETLGQTSVGKAVSGVVAAATDHVRDWWAGTPAERLRLDELDTRIAASGSDLVEAVRERSRVLADLHESADAEIQALEQDLRSETRIDDARDLLRDQRELARERFEQVSAEREVYLGVVGDLDALLAARELLLQQLASAQDEISKARQEGLAPLNEQLRDVGGEKLKITVDCESLADRSVAIEFLNESILTMDRAGQYLRMQVAEKLMQMSRPAEVSAGLVTGDVALIGSALSPGMPGALSGAEVTKLVEGCSWRRQDEDAEVPVFDDAVGSLLVLAEQPIDDRVRIRLNEKPVDELSPGQRSSAMLPLIALAETDPLVIDQPEDNLDNAMVGETFTRILTDLKERRQIIVSTHNPNIVVGGDAEQVIVLEAAGARRAEVKRTGSIDDGQIIDDVLTIMEGGRQAFIARRKRYRVS